ncbi:MAG: hypothetical protein EOP48_06400 [Sphingobacteriales bacterium]|nr:MAG: hypothetical protein EOP48_06400 [Sphingobacteriales bacterium]
MNNPKLYWLRWVGILPCAVVCYLIAFFSVKLYDFIFLRAEAGDINLLHLIVPGLASGIAGYFFVYIGTAIAPNYRKIVALILMIIAVLVSGMGAFILIIYRFDWQVLLETLGQVVGAAIAFYVLLEEKL